MYKFIKKMFIPGRHNNWRPHAFRHRALSIYSVGLILSQFSFGVILYTPVATDTAALKDSVFWEINHERLEMGVGPLQENEYLSEAATNKLADMFSRNYWDHVSPEGVKAWYFIDNTGYTYDIAGENLARGFITADSMTEAWMKSPTHKANILNPTYKDTGIAIGNGVINGKLTTVAVQLFGNPSPTITANKTLVAGEKSLSVTTDLGNPISHDRMPFFVIYLFIFGLLIFDGFMIKAHKLHKKKKQLRGLRVSLMLNVVVLLTLLVNLLSIY